jgi:hypothetical protein
MALESKSRGIDVAKADVAVNNMACNANIMIAMRCCNK